jgi:hypothetical protein
MTGGLHVFEDPPAGWKLQNQRSHFDKSFGVISEVINAIVVQQTVFVEYLARVLVAAPGLRREISILDTGFASKILIIRFLLPMVEKEVRFPKGTTTGVTNNLLDLFVVVNTHELVDSHLCHDGF